jgi:hypothetical protein
MNFHFEALSAIHKCFYESVITLSSANFIARARNSFLKYFALRFPPPFDDESSVPSEEETFTSEAEFGGDVRRVAAIIEASLTLMEILKSPRN